mmetsp:Transcript_22298/g.63221  ORF Transcript_22298/g.63221 Transcript_22298/m.63221 type:complete len:149 (+) Transcript_22298:51-497(+)
MAACCVMVAKGALQPRHHLVCYFSRFLSPCSSLLHEKEDYAAAAEADSAAVTRKSRVDADAGTDVAAKDDAEDEEADAERMAASGREDDRGDDADADAGADAVDAGADAEDDADSASGEDNVVGGDDAGGDIGGRVDPSRVSCLPFCR